MLFNFSSFESCGSSLSIGGRLSRVPCRMVDDTQPVWMQMMALFGLPHMRDLLFGRYKRKRRFWAALRDGNVWDEDFLRNYPTMSVQWNVPDFEDQQYMEHVRMGKSEFWHLHEEFGRYITFQDSKWRLCVPSHKRLAITLHWLANGNSYSQLARQHGIAKSTAVKIVHETVRALKMHMVPNSIRFPEGQELKRVMAEFESLSFLERCAGAVDGTFVKIRKPKAMFGDCYYCYKKYCSIILLGTVDACGMFINVNAGRPGSAGDASAYATSTMLRRISQQKWLTIQDNFRIEGTYIRPYLVGDSAFPLCATLMKCFDDSAGLQPHERTFNYRLIRTRRVVEQAFGRLKGRFRVLVHNNLDDPDFAADVAIVCCGLHNICERWKCPMEPTWLINTATYNQFHPGPNDQPHDDYEQAGWTVRRKLARRTHRDHPVV